MDNTGIIKQEAPPPLPLEIFEIPGEPAVVINGVPDEPQTDSMIAKDEPKPATVGCGEWLEGREVRKFFLGQYYSGTVTKFDKGTGWYMVEYEDGDSEELDWSELEEVLLPMDTKNSNTNGFGYCGEKINLKHKTSEAFSKTVKAPYQAHRPKKLIVVIDDPLTVGPEITSEEVGRAQGMYASADQKSFGLFVAFNLVFTKGEFAGSTASLYGRNPVMSKVREMPIIAGTGAFRFGRGYAQARTFTFNTTSGNAVVEYNVYIWH
ncbi:dirigent protein 17 isoform X2 [Brassica rapa]|uniref:dirigent protein 17 isoform X2 n=1 Tax=Brassica campestris TaxID=3711 RepID=UPI00142E6903|nr:dirigent protein 17 isoform X2 [Brassica rapa]